MENKSRIAVLIDGDNATPKRMGDIFEELKSLGKIVIKKVYGDFSQANLNPWKDVAIKHAIKTIHGYNYSKRKNSTDIHLIIDAMDILLTTQIDILCIVSSDCDFTGLINRAKEDGVYTIGIGRKDSCVSYKEACDLFMTEEKIKKDTSSQKANTIEKTTDEAPSKELKVEAPILQGPKVVGKLDLKLLTK